MNEWHFVSGLTYLKVSRTHWWGVWDNLKAIILRKDVYTIAEPIKVEFYAKSNIETKDCYFEINGFKLEVGNVKT